MRIATLTIVLLGLTLSSAATIDWTGAAGNSLWSFPSNWLGNVLPTASDDVFINQVGGVSVTISQPAFAKSITIGGSTYAQSLTLLSSVTVGVGGISILSKGTLQLQGNNDLPLTTTGNVTAQAGGAIVFSSGDITGPGSYVINDGASIVFSGSALKLIDSTNLVIYGTATIQPSTIQLADSAAVYNYGALTAVGLINIFANDKSSTAFYNNGNFTYQGTSTSTLTFQVPAFFSTDLVIQAGVLILNEHFYSTAAIRIPSGSSVTVNSGATEKIFGAVTGAGSLVVQGLAEFAGTLSVSLVTVTTSGSLVLSSNASTKTLALGGTLMLNSGVTFTSGDVTLTAGTVTGTGQLLSTGNFQITESTNGNTNSFISTQVTIAGNGYTTGPIYLLFSALGNLNILKGVTFKVTAATNFLKQSGTPVITNAGTFSIVLNSGSVFYSNVDHTGAGTLDVVSGLVTFEADMLTTGPISVGATALVNINAAIVNAGAVTGVGAINVTAVPSPTSVFGDVSISYFGVPNGFVQVKSLNSDTLEVYNGELHFGSGSVNKATIFNWYGGALRGSARISSSAVLLQGSVAQVLDAIVLTTSKLTINTGTNSMLTTINGAQIIAGQ